jgi:hypothetical protein
VIWLWASDISETFRCLICKGNLQEASVLLDDTIKNITTCIYFCMVIQRVAYPLGRDNWMLKELIHEKLFSRKSNTENQLGGGGNSEPLLTEKLKSAGRTHSTDSNGEIPVSGLLTNVEGDQLANNTPRKKKKGNSLSVKRTIKRNFDDFDNDDTDDSDVVEVEEGEDEKGEIEEEEKMNIIKPYTSNDKRLIFRHIVEHIIFTLYYFYYIFIGKTQLIQGMVEVVFNNNAGYDLLLPSETVFSEPVKPYINTQQNLFVLNSKLINPVLLLCDIKASSIYYEVSTNDFSLNSVDSKRVFMLNSEWICGLEVCILFLFLNLFVKVLLLYYT